MDQDAEVEFELNGVLRIYKSGRVERLYGTETVPPSDDPSDEVASRDVVLDGAAANVSARLYLPAAAQPGERLPVVVFFHGGAFMVNTAASPIYHTYAASLAAAVPAVVVSVDYRLAPEHPVPAAYHDGVAAIRSVLDACRAAPDHKPSCWLAAHGDASRVAVVGDSSGANMAHHAAIRLRKDVSGVALLHPYFWGKQPLGGEPADRGQFERTWEVACGGMFGIDHPYINPMAAPEEWKQLGCRRMLVTTAEQCWFVERARAYAEGINKCGWEGALHFHETKGEGHGYFLFKPDCENAAKELAVVADFVRRC